MNEVKKVKKCELCSCEVKKPFSASYFDFCMNCIIGDGKCKKCQTKPDLDKLTRIRLKVEMTILGADWNLEDSEILREMLKEFETSQKATKKD